MIRLFLVFVLFTFYLPTLTLSGLHSPCWALRVFHTGKCPPTLVHLIGKLKGKGLQFTFLYYCTSLFDPQTFSSCFHLYEAHLGPEAAHPAVQEQHSYNHKCLKKWCNFLGSDSLCPLHPARAETTEKKIPKLMQFHTSANHLVFIIFSYLLLHQWLFPKLLIDVCTRLNVTAVHIRFFIRRTVSERSVNQKVLTLTDSKVTFLSVNKQILGCNNRWAYTPEYSVLRDGISCWAQQRVGHRKGPQPGKFGFQCGQMSLKLWHVINKHELF